MEAMDYAQNVEYKRTAIIEQLIEKAFLDGTIYMLTRIIPNINDI